MKRQYNWTRHCPNCDKEFVWKLKTKCWSTPAGNLLCSKDCALEFKRKLENTKLRKYSKPRVSKAEAELGDYLTKKWDELLNERYKGKTERVVKDSGY